MTAPLNLNRIIMAREANGLAQAELAEKIGMSATNLSKIERSDIGIQSDILEKIADVTHFPIHFFYQQGQMVAENLSYRKRQTVAQKLITPINATANIIRNNLQFLNTALSNPVPALPKMEVTQAQTPAAIAAKLRKLWGIQTPVINNITKVVEAKGLAIAAFNFQTERVDSLSILTDDKYPIICCNKTLLADRLRFTIAYELGQLIMHTYRPVPLNRNITKEASEFAAAFLMPAAEIKKDFAAGVTIPLLGEMKRKWKISMIALLYRADDLGLLTPNQKRYLLQQFNQLKIRRREPVELDIPAEQPKLIQQWIQTYTTKNKLGTAQMAALLCLYPDDFTELYF